MHSSIKRLNWSDAHLADIKLPTGTMRLTRSLASGLCQSPLDAPDIFWGVGDRGPNIKPGSAADKYGTEHLRALAEIDGAKIMPLPATGPALARFRLSGDTVVLEAVVEITDANGTGISGLPVPYGPHAEFEPVYDLAGAPLPTDPNGADSEGIAAMPDGSFWIAEEYGPSLLRVDRQGRVLVRWVPVGLGASFDGAAYPVTEALPPIAAARKLNRGFEAIAASADGSSLYVAFQSPLAHPNREAHERSRHVRIWQLDAANGALLAEYIYPLDDPDSFRRDAEAGKVGRDDIKISEIQLVDDGQMLVLERITLSTKIYRVALHAGAAAPAALSNPETRPTLEQMSRKDLMTAGIPVLGKTLLFSSDDHPEICADLEGMILLGPGHLLLSNDSDFGIEGAETQFWRVDVPGLVS
jgi:Esterase-like activity of phytase